MKRLSVLVLLLFICGTQCASTKEYPWRKIAKFPNQNLIFYEMFHVEDKVAYATCDGPVDTNERKCTIIREKFPFKESPYTCNITLKAEHKNGIVALALNVVPFGDDNVVVAWSEKHIPFCLKLTTIKMSSCESSETRVFTQEFHEAYPLPFAAAFFVSYTNYYDVFFKNYTLCSAEWCKMTVDTDSNIINGPVGTINHYLACSQRKKFVIPLMSDSLDKGLFYVGCSVDETDRVYNYNIIKPDGSEITFMEDHNKPTGKSTANGIISVCYNIHDTYSFNCTQRTSDGKLGYLLFDAVGEWHSIIDMYNLPDNSILILSANDKSSEDVSYVLMKVDADGQKYKNFKIPYQKTFSGISDTQVFQNRDKSYCVSSVIYNLSNDNYMDLYANCFTDEDFVAS